MVSDKIKLLFVTSIIGMVILICGIYWPPGASVQINSFSSTGIVWPAGIVVSVPMALLGLVITGISCALITRDIRISLTKYQAEIKAHSSPLNKTLWLLARCVLAIGFCCLLYTAVLDNQIQTNLPNGVNTIGATPADIHAGVITAEFEFLYAIVGLFILIFGLFLEAIRLENIIWYMKIKPDPA